MIVSLSRAKGRFVYCPIWQKASFVIFLERVGAGLFAVNYKRLGIPKLGVPQVLCKPTMWATLCYSCGVWGEGKGNWGECDTHAVSVSCLPSASVKLQQANSSPCKSDKFFPLTITLFFCLFFVFLIFLGVQIQLSPFSHRYHILFFLRFYLFIFRERAREGEREGETSMCSCLSCTPTADLAHNPGMCPDWESNQRPFGSQARAQSPELHQWGLHHHIVKKNLFKICYW